MFIDVVHHGWYVDVHLTHPYRLHLLYKLQRNSQQHFQFLVIAAFLFVRCRKRVSIHLLPPWNTKLSLVADGPLYALLLLRLPPMRPGQYFSEVLSYRRGVHK